MELEERKIRTWLSFLGRLPLWYLPLSLIALLIASVVAYCEVSIVCLWCSEAVVIGAHRWGSFSGSCTLHGPFAFSPGCAHQGRGPRYPLKTGVPAQNCMTSIVADTGHSTSCGKPID